MKFRCYILLASLSALPAAAQTSNAGPDSATTQIFNLSLGRTENQRIDFLLNVAQSYVNEGDFKSAIDAYERILSIDPAHEQAQYTVSYIYISAKQYKKAENTLNLLLEGHPEDFHLMNNLAWLYATAEDPSVRNAQKAIDFAHEAMVLEPNDYHVWNTLSEAYYVAGDYEKAYRAIIHMAGLAARYGQDITKESVETYNEQIRKCKRALDASKAFEPETDSEN